MKRLLIFIVVAVAAWYGWKNYDKMRPAPANEVVIENETGQTVGRLRLSIGDQEFPAYDSVYVGKSVVQRFPLSTHDGQFQLHWALQGKAYDASWAGGLVTAGPVRMRHVLQMQPDMSVVWSSKPIEDGK